MTLCLSVNVQHTLIQFLHASNLFSLSMRGQNRDLIHGTTIARRAAFAALVRCVRSISGATFSILMKRVAKILLLFVTAASLWIYALCDCFPVKLSPTHQFWVHVVCASHLFRFATSALINQMHYCSCTVSTVRIGGVRVLLLVVHWLQHAYVQRLRRQRPRRDARGMLHAFVFHVLAYVVIYVFDCNLLLLHLRISQKRRLICQARA